MILNLLLLEKKIARDDWCNVLKFIFSPFYLIYELWYPEMSFSFVIKYVFKIQKIWIYLLIRFFYPDENNNNKKA